jgi:hypothetical protein
MTTWFNLNRPIRPAVDMTLLVPRSLDNANALPTSPQPQHHQIKLDQLLRNKLIGKPNRLT